MQEAIRHYARVILVSLPPLLSALFAMVAPAAAAAQDHERVLESIAPQDRQAYVQRLVAQQRARAAASPGVDVTGPVLTAFSAATVLNLSKSAAPFKVTVKATDDLSGVTGAYFYAYGPSGQYVYVSANVGYPLTSFNYRAGISGVNRLLEPGTWKFTYGYAYDAAGNYGYFDEAALDALGNTTFTIVNNGGYDLVKPTLVGGDIVTPSVSLSSVIPGTTDKLPYVKVKVNAADTGSTALSGVRQVYAYFCQVADPDVCLSLSGTTYATGLATMTLYVGRQLTGSNATGTYELQYVYVYDQASNYNAYFSTAFGGTTDFSAYFPGGTTIRIKP